MYVVKYTHDSISAVWELAEENLGGQNRGAEGVKGEVNGEEVPLPSRLRGLGERRKLPEWGPVLVHFELLKPMCSHHITSHHKSYSAQSYRLKIDRLCITMSM